VQCAVYAAKGFAGGSGIEIGHGDGPDVRNVLQEGFLTFTVVFLQARRPWCSHEPPFYFVIF